MQKQVRCPRCKTPQPMGERCVSCGLDFREYARKLREKRAAGGGAPRRVRCPKCKTVQTMGEKCVNCGLDFKEYARKAKERSEAGAKAAPGPAKASVESAFERKPREIILPSIEPEPEPATGLSDIGTLLNNTWLIFRSRFGILLGLYLIATACMLVPMGATFGVGMLAAASMPSAFVVLFIISMFGGLIAILAWMWGMASFLSAACDEMQGFGDALKSGWRNMWSLLWLYLIVGYVIQGGILLFVIPGIVWAVSFFASQFIIFDERVTGMTAMLKSRAYVKGRWWAVFGRLLLIFLLLMASSAIPFGSIVFTPFMMIYLVLLYRELRAIKGPELKFSASTGSKAGWIALATVGYVVPVVLVLVFVGTAALKSIPNLKDFESLSNMDVSQFEQMVPTPPEGIEMERQAAPAGPEASYEPELRLDKNSFVTGERIVVHFKAPSTFASNAWVGIVPATAPHGNEAENDRYDIAYQYLSGRTSGEMVFTAPPDPGIYDVRMNDTDDNGSEVAYETFAVETGTPPPVSQASSASITTLKSSYAVNEPIEVDFSGLPGNSKDWITLVMANTPDNAFGEWFYTGGLSSGRHTFGGVAQPGSYEVRVHFDSPDGGFDVQARHAFTVGDQSSFGSEGMDNGSMSGEATMVMDGETKRYALLTGFSSDTRFENPSRAEISFGPQSTVDFTSNEKIEMVIDATKQGRHYVDGQAVADGFMGEDRVRVGNMSSKGYEAKLQWVAYGGQVYFPAGDCYIDVSRAHGGGAGGVFSGRVSDCTVHSAGIDKRISSFEFTISGKR